MPKKEEKTFASEIKKIFQDEQTRTKRKEGSKDTFLSVGELEYLLQDGQILTDGLKGDEDFLTLTQGFRAGTSGLPLPDEQSVAETIEEGEDSFALTHTFEAARTDESPPPDKQPVVGEIEEGEDLFTLTQAFKPAGTDAGFPPNEQSVADEMEKDEDLLTVTQSFGVGSGELVDKVNWEIGDVIDGRYEVREILGQGGMGIVYKVHHREWDLDLAVKMPLPALVANEVSKARFILEAQTWVNLGLHPNIVQCWYVRELGGIPRVFMDYLSGGNLKDWMLDGNVKPGEWDTILDLVIQACDGLGYAHEHGIEAHRDVKPGNMLLNERGELRVADFGIAKSQGSSDIKEKIITVSSGTTRHTATISGSALGTPEYGAPEQWGEAKHADARADIYALGIVLFELCCGRRPFDDGIHREHPHVLIGRHLITPAPDPRTFKKTIPSVLAELILQCLAKEPDDRPNSMAELRDKLAKIYNQVIRKPYWRDVPQAAELRSSALNNRAVSLLDLGRKEEAFATLDEALKLDAHHAESVYNKSLLQWREEIITDDEVVRRLKEAKQVSRRAGLYLGFIHLERAAADEAEKELTRALQDDDKDVSAWRALGDALMAQEKYSEADDAYQHALESMPGDSLLLQRKTLAQKRTRRQHGHIVFPYPRCLQTLVGYNDRLSAVTLMPDGRFIILGDSEEIKLWDLLTGRYLWTFTWSEETVWTFKGYANSMTSVAVTPNRELAISGGSYDANVRVWDVATGTCLQTLKGHTHDVTSVAVTLDGKCVLSGSFDRTLRLWNLATGRCVRILKGHRYAVRAVTVTPNGQYALSGGGNTLHLWDLATGKHLRKFRGHRGIINTVAVTPNGYLAVSGSRDKTLRLWKLASGKCLRIFIGHTDSITTVVITPDGRFAVSGSQDKTLRVWNLATGKCVWILKGHKGGVTAVAVTPNGRFIVSQSRDKTLRLWSLTTGKCFRIFKEYTYWLEAITLTPDGRFAIIGNSDEMRLKDLTTGAYLQTFKKYKEDEDTMMVMSDGRFAGLTGDDETLRLWELPVGENFLTVKGKRGGRITVAVTPNGRFAISGGKDETLQLWDLLSGKCPWIFRGQGGFHVFKKDRSLMNCIALTQNERFAISGWYDASVRLWDLTTGECLRTFEGHTEIVTAIAVTPDGRFIVSGSHDRTLRLWDRATGTCLQTFEGHEESVTAVAVTPDGRFAISGSNDRTLRLWELTTGKCLRTFEGHEDSVTVVAMTPNGQFAISGSNDRTLRLWLLDAEVQRPKAALQVCRHRAHQELQIFRERFQKYLARSEAARKEGKIATAYTFLALARSIPGYERDPQALALNAALGKFLQRKDLRGGRLLRLLEGHKDYVTTVAATPSGRFAVSGSRDRTVRLWKLTTGKCLRIFEGHDDYVTTVAVTPNGRFAVSGSRDKTLRLWALATGECLKIFRGHEDYVKAVAISPDGRFAISGSSDRTERLWTLGMDRSSQAFEKLNLSLGDAYRSAELATDKCLRIFKGHTWDVETVAITPDGRLAISGSRDKTLRLWSLTTGKCLRIFKGHEDYVTCVAIIPNGQFAISGGRDRTLRLWKLSTNMCLRVFRGHKESVTCVTITPDGRFVISGSWDRTLRLWKLTTGECLRTFERHEETVETVAMTLDGQSAISGGRDNTLRVWEFDWGLAPSRTVIIKS